MANVICSACSAAAISEEMGGSIASLFEKKIKEKGCSRLDVKTYIKVSLNGDQIQDIKNKMGWKYGSLGLIIDGES